MKQEFFVNFRGVVSVRKGKERLVHGDSYGLGIWIKKAENRRILYFTGSDPGVSFISLFNRTRGENITLLSNYGDNVWTLGDNILRILWEAR